MPPSMSPPTPVPDLARQLVDLLSPIGTDTEELTALTPRVVDAVGALTGPQAALWAVECSCCMTRDLATEQTSDRSFLEAVSLWAVLKLSGVHAIPDFLMRPLATLVREQVDQGRSLDAALLRMHFAHSWLTRTLFETCACHLPAVHQTPTMSIASAGLFDGMATFACAITHEFITEQAFPSPGRTPRRMRDHVGT